MRQSQISNTSEISDSFAHFMNAKDSQEENKAFLKSMPTTMKS